MKRPISELLQKAGFLVHTSPTTSVADAVEVMSEHNIGAIVVLENKTSLAGIFTERDVMRRVVNEGRDPVTTPVREVMTEDVIVVPEDMARSDALQIMQEEHIRHLPVSDGESLSGLVSLRDLLRFEHKMQQRTIDQLRDFVIKKPYPKYPG